MNVTMAPDEPMTVERAVKEIQRVLAQLEGTGVVVNDIGMLQYNVTSLNDKTPVYQRQVYINLRQPIPEFTPFKD